MRLSDDIGEKAIFFVVHFQKKTYYNQYKIA